MSTRRRKNSRRRRDSQHGRVLFSALLARLESQGVDLDNDLADALNNLYEAGWIQKPMTATPIYDDDGEEVDYWVDFRLLTPELG